MNYDRAESKIMVNEMDLSSIEAKAFTRMKEMQANKEQHGGLPRLNLSLVKASITYRWGWVETPNGVYAFCNEGIGDSNPINKENQFEILVSAEYSGGHLDLFPCLGYKLDAEEVKSLPIKAQVSLDKFIRNYNHRTESNYHAWNVCLSKELKQEVEA